MGALVSKALRPLKSFNIENRAHRVISKEKPVPAPKYQSNIEDLKRALVADPDLDAKLDRKDPGLDERLKDVYVTSLGRPEDDITRERTKQNPNRPLPLNRNQVEDFEMGFKEPEKVAYGRITLRQAIDFISAHEVKPEEVTSAKIAYEYKLREDDVVSILKYFKAYEIYLPETRQAPATFAGPTTLRQQMKLEKANVKQIDDKKSSSEDNIDEKQMKGAALK